MRVGAPKEDQLLGFMLSSVQRFRLIEEVDVPTVNYDEFVVLFGLVAQKHPLCRRRPEVHSVAGP